MSGQITPVGAAQVHPPRSRTPLVGVVDEFGKTRLSRKPRLAMTSMSPAAMARKS